MFSTYILPFVQFQLKLCYFIHCAPFNYSTKTKSFVPIRRMWLHRLLFSISMSYNFLMIVALTYWDRFSLGDRMLGYAMLILLSFANAVRVAWFLQEDKMLYALNGILKYERGAFRQGKKTPQIIKITHTESHNI
jgi:hypothetical protein